MAKEQKTKVPKKVGPHLSPSDTYTPKNNVTNKKSGYKKSGWGK
jgi:hypothetical protein